MLNANGKATWREITVGLVGREGVEVTAGLSPGDLVVISAGANSTPLRDGRSIRSK
jgi:hypothetical protein